MKDLISFNGLRVGDRFRLPTPVGYVGGVYFKTGEGSYGNRPDEPLWDWLDMDWLAVERVPATFELPNTFNRGRSLGGLQPPSLGALPQCLSIAEPSAPAAISVRGRSVADHPAHNRTVGGSIPSPATNRWKSGNAES